MLLLFPFYRWGNRLASIPWLGSDPSSLDAELLTTHILSLAGILHVKPRSKVLRARKQSKGMILPAIDRDAPMYGSAEALGKLLTVPVLKAPTQCYGHTTPISTDTHQPSPYRNAVFLQRI